MRTVIVGVGRKVTPGRCAFCGCDDGWEADGRDVIYCECQTCPECHMFDGHEIGCSADTPETLMQT